MANARPRDSRAGFDIFRSAGGDISLDDLNQRLVEAGYGPVAKRTLDHYHSLVQEGFDRYISINRFDVARAATPYGDSSSNARYLYADVDEGASLVFAKRSRLFEAAARVVEVGESGAIFRLLDEEAVDGVAKLKPQPGEMVSVRFLESAVTRTGRVIEVDVKSRPALVEIEYSKLVSLADLGVGESFPEISVSYRITGTDEEQLTTELLGQRLYEFFEIVDEIRGLVNAASSPSADRPSYAPPPTVESLMVASPAIIAMSIAEQVRDAWPVALAAGLLTPTAAIAGIRKVWHDGTGSKLDNQTKRLDNEAKTLANEQATAHQALTNAITEQLTESFPDAALDTDHIRHVVDERIVPSIRRLAENGVTAIEEIEGSESSTQGDDAS